MWVRSRRFAFAFFATAAASEAVECFLSTARYKDVKQLQTDAKKVFKNTEIANDGMIILI